MRVFIIGAIVLIVFGIIGSAAASGTCLGTLAITWFMASFLSYLADIVFGGVWVGSGGVRHGPQV